MLQLSKLILCSLLSLCFMSRGSSPYNTISKGQQPQITTDNKGIVRVVFGGADSIFCSTSSNQGKTFSKPVLVGVVPKMHLGMARGPQLATSADYSVITAMDQKGDIHFFVLKHNEGGWERKGFVNDVRSSAPEGLMNIAADKQNNFYATWLDLRAGKSNNIYFSSIAVSKTDKWLKNSLIYKSPDGHVCECCRPSIAVQGSQVAIMFRNWLLGSRDLYLIKSNNRGETFAAAQKLGNGTWKLNACPMDGGGLSFNNSNSINTVWQRQGIVYACEPGKMEIELGNGRDCSIISNNDQEIVAMGSNGDLKLKYLKTNKEIFIGKGSYLKTLSLPGDHILCVWQDDDTIKSKVM
ncbi:MAG: hypothetical protein JWP44_3431 [Mucilaginibacter sp.]|nr:hypothetical protein [Mucilaginibacter sp.]